MLTTAQEIALRFAVSLMTTAMGMMRSSVEFHTAAAVTFRAAETALDEGGLPGEQIVEEAVCNDEYDEASVTESALRFMAENDELAALCD